MHRLKLRRFRRLAKSACVWMLAFGFNPAVWRHACCGLIVAMKEYRELKRQNRANGRPFQIHFSMPCLGDRYVSSGTASGHYFFQDLLVARKIFERKPVRHVDVGSRIDGFVAHVASFRNIEVFDIRPLAIDLPSIIFRQADLMRLDPAYRHCCDSLSCLHAIEHFGLGRYGDMIDLFGHMKGFESLGEIVKPGGVLYFSTPIGPERVDFNACRVFAVQTLLEMAKERFDLMEFSYVDDAGIFHANVELTSGRIADNCGCDYGCGIFEFRRNMV